MPTIQIHDGDELLWTIDVIDDRPLLEDHGFTSAPLDLDDILALISIDYEASHFDMSIGSRYRLSARDGDLFWTDEFIYTGQDYRLLGDRFMKPCLRRSFEKKLSRPHADAEASE